MAMTLRQAEKRILALDTAVTALQAAVSALQGGVPVPSSNSVLWRRPLIVLSNEPVDSTVKSGVVGWSWVGEGVMPAVTYRLDGGSAKPAPSTGVAWGPLTVGPHRIDLYLAGSSSPEATTLWRILAA